MRAPQSQESAGAKANRLMGELHDEIESQEKASWKKTLNDIMMDVCGQEDCDTPHEHRALKEVVRERLTELIRSQRAQARREGRDEILAIIDRADNAFPVEDHSLARFGHKLLAEIKAEAARSIGEEKGEAQMRHWLAFMKPKRTGHGREQHRH